MNASVNALEQVFQATRDLGFFDPNHEDNRVFLHGRPPFETLDLICISILTLYVAIKNAINAGRQAIARQEEALPHLIRRVAWFLNFLQEALQNLVDDGTIEFIEQGIGSNNSLD